MASGSTASTVYAYDGTGRVTSQTDPLSYATTRVFNALNEVTSQTVHVTLSSTLTSTYTYDPAGNLATVQAPGPNGVTLKTTYTVNGTNDVTAAQTTVVGDTTILPGSTSGTYSAGHVATAVVNPHVDNPLFSPADVTSVYTYTAKPTDTTTGQVLTETTPDGLVTKYAYDTYGNRTSTILNYQGGTQTSTSDVTTTYAYDASTTAGKAGLVTSETDPLGRVTTYQYDALGRVTQTVHNKVTGSSATDTNLTSLTSFDAIGWSSATVDPRGIVTRTVTDKLGRVTEQIQDCTDSGSTPSPSPASCVGAGTHNGATNMGIDATYDALGRVLISTQRDPLTSMNDVLAVNSYDSDGRLVETIADQGSGRLNLTTDKAYDGQGREIAEMDPRGSVARSLYDDAGNLIESIQNCTNSGTTTFSRPPSTAWQTCAGTGTADATWNLVTAYTFDSSGSQLTQTDSNSRLTTITSDSARRVIDRVDNNTGAGTGNQDLETTFVFDVMGRTLGVRSPTATRMTWSVSASTYDALGRQLTQDINCTNTGAGTSVPGTPACDEGGTKDAVTNLLTVWTYDAAGNKLSETSPKPSDSASMTNTVTTRYAYDGADRLCRVLENAQEDLQALVHPCLDSLTVTPTASSNVATAYVYDVSGNLTTMTDGRGNGQAYAFDAAGRMTSRTDGLGHALTWTYDVRDNRLTQVNRVGSPAVAVTWTYDNADRMHTRVADGATITYGYDAEGNLTSAQGTAGTISPSYDRLSRPTQVVPDDSSANTTYTYSLTAPARTDASGSYSFVLNKQMGWETSATAPLSTTAFLTTYRPDGRVSTRTDPNGNTTTYAYDVAQRMLTKTTLGSGGTPTRASYVYTDNRAGLRLSEASVLTGDPANGTASFAYDALGRLTTYGSPLGTSTNQAYTWQAVPNRDSLSTGGGTPITTTYNAADRITTSGYSYDLDGNLTGQPGQTLEWDSLGRLTKVRDSSTNAVISAYTYDALDRLRTVARGSSTIRFHYVGTTTQVSEIVDDATGTSQLKVGNSWSGERLAVWTGSGSNPRYYGSNGHGDTTWTADGSGAVIATLRYDPWGRLAASSGTSLPDWRFQGTWLDTSVDLYWVVARWYAPALGQFTSEDAVLGSTEWPATLHSYIYGLGRPTGFTDTSGNASSATDTTSFANPNNGSGTFLIKLFIKEAKVSVKPFGVNPLPDIAWLKGDDRGFSSAFDCVKTRACFKVNLDAGAIRTVIHPSCGKVVLGDWKCHDAYAINDFWGFNQVHLNQSGAEVHFWWHLSVSALPQVPVFEVVPSIDGEFDFRPPEPGKSNGVTFIANDGFPSVEVYFEPRDGSWESTMFRKSEGDPSLLYGGADWATWMTWPREPSRFGGP